MIQREKNTLELLHLIFAHSKYYYSLFFHRVNNTPKSLEMSDRSEISEYYDQCKTDYIQY